jgi:hypothetical protein
MPKRAAKNVGQLIFNSIERVETGVVLVNLAGDVIDFKCQQNF